MQTDLIAAASGTLKLDVKRLVRRMGGRKQLRLRLARYAESHHLPGITDKGLDKWVERESVPPNWLAVIVALSEQDGRPVNLRDFAR